MQAWVIGNWKQNPATSHDADALLDDLLTKVDAKNQAKTPTSSSQCKLMVAPSCIHLAAVSARLANSSIVSAAQDVSAHSASTGAYTGDCSAQQVADTGATWTILGHSERRQYHKESHDCLINKLSHAFSQNLGVVFCIGETQEQYDNGQTLDVINEQLSVIKDLLAQQPDITASLSERLIIAYEPVWAIGTGVVATPEQAQDIHEKLRTWIKDNVSAEVAENVEILYGGSVNGKNCKDLGARPDIDGFLVGGASLKPEFADIINARQ